MKTSKIPSRNVTVAFLLVAGLIVGGGSFAMASGDIAMSPTSLLAAVYSSLSGKPIVYLTKSTSSPSGTVTTGGNRTLAVFDVSAKNVTLEANLKSISVEIPRTGTAASNLTLSNIYATYSYCIPSGVTYGYGYKGGNCSSVKTTQASSVVATAAGTTYKLQFLLNAPVYPQQNRGVLTVYALPSYSVGGTATDIASIRVGITSGQVSGDQCASYKSIPAGNHSAEYLKNYGYSKCVSVAGSVTAVSANTLQVQRSYGYGYCLM